MVDLESLYDLDIREIDVNLRFYKLSDGAAGDIFIDDPIRFELLGKRKSSRRSMILFIQASRLARSGELQLVDPSGALLAGDQPLAPGVALQTAEGKRLPPPLPLTSTDVSWGSDVGPPSIGPEAWAADHSHIEARPGGPQGDGVGYSDCDGRAATLSRHLGKSVTGTLFSEANAPPPAKRESPPMALWNGVPVTDFPKPQRPADTECGRFNPQALKDQPKQRRLPQPSGRVGVTPRIVVVRRLCVPRGWRSSPRARRSVRGGNGDRSCSRSGWPDRGGH